MATKRTGTLGSSYGLGSAHQHLMNNVKVAMVIKKKPQIQRLCMHMLKIVILGKIIWISSVTLELCKQTYCKNVCNGCGIKQLIESFLNYHPTTWITSKDTHKSYIDYFISKPVSWYVEVKLMKLQHCPIIYGWARLFFSQIYNKASYEPVCHYNQR